MSRLPRLGNVPLFLLLVVTAAVATAIIFPTRFVRCCLHIKPSFLPNFSTPVVRADSRTKK